MSPKKTDKDNVSKRKKDTISIEYKKEIIGKHKCGVSVADLVMLYGHSSSTISTILKKEEIKKLDASKGITKTSKCREAIVGVDQQVVSRWYYIWWYYMCESKKTVCRPSKDDTTGRGVEQINFISIILNGDIRFKIQEFSDMS